MAVDSDEIHRMYVKIAQGTAKADYPWKLSVEASALWDRIEREVAALRAQGEGFEAPQIEVPDIPSWITEAPESPST